MNYQEKNLECCERIQKAVSPEDKEDALTELYLLNEGMIRSLIMKMSYFIEYDYEISDMLQIGFMALAAAAHRYDKNKGSFSTYAYYWILHAIQKGYGENHGTIRVPAGPAVLTSRYIAKTHLRPDSDEFFESLEMDKTLTEKERETIRRVIETRATVSYNAQIANDEEGDEFIDHMSFARQDGYAPSAEDEAITNIAKSELDEILTTLEPREEWIIRHRKVDHEWTLEECAKRCPWGEMSITRAYQIEKGALEKIRASSKSGLFKDLLS